MNASQRSLNAYRALERLRHDLENENDLLRRQLNEATQVIEQRNGECVRLIREKEKALDDACTATQNSDRWMSRALSAEAQLMALRDALQALDNFAGSL